MLLWLVSLLSLGLCASMAVKNETAGGYGSFEPAPASNNYQLVHFPQPIYTTFSHVCAIDVGYGIYGNKKHRSSRPSENTCDHVLVGYSKNGDRKNNQNCNKCCKNSARLSGFSTKDVLGMILIMDSRPRCVCCAPTAPVASAPSSPSTGY